MNAPTITDHEFGLFRDLIYELVGVNLSPAKKPLVVGRLNKRLRHHNLSSFHDYFRYITDRNDLIEQQMLVDLLTTNETYFFREHKHFDFVRDEVLPQVQLSSRPYRVWSAAASSGEEAYTLAMILADGLGVDRDWNILATDINSQVLERARRGSYPVEAAEKIPRNYLQHYCLKGVGGYEGTLAIDKKLRDKVQFQQLNLNRPWNAIGQFDQIFLRNVMIYFDLPTKQRLIDRLQTVLRPGGYLFVGHSEGLSSISSELKLLRPSIYQKIK